MRRIILLLAIIIAGAYQTVLGQNVAVKTNLLNDAFLNPNIGIEVGLAPKWTLEAAGQFNAWNLSHDRRWKHWALQPEARYWLCDRFGAHFFGIHMHGGQYNIRRYRRKNQLLGHRCTEAERHTLPGLVCGSRRSIWIRMDIGSPLES